MRELQRFVRFRLLCFGLVTSQTPVENNTESLCSQVVHIDVCLQQCDSSGTSESNSEFWCVSNFWGHTVLNMIAKATTGSKNKPCVNLEFCLFRYILRNLTLWPGNSVCWRWFLATFHAANIAFDFLCNGAVFHHTGLRWLVGAIWRRCQQCLHEAFHVFRMEKRHQTTHTPHK